jgi:hypothetical protein
VHTKRDTTVHISCEHVLRVLQKKFAQRDLTIQGQAVDTAYAVVAIANSNFSGGSTDGVAK